MADITPDQQAELKKLARRANQRLYSASEGQRNFAQSYMRRNYGFEKFSTRKAQSEGEFIKRMQQLQGFLGSESTKKRGWMEQTQKAVSGAAETLRRRGYTFTEDELSNILTEIKSKDKDDFYRYLDLLQAQKYTEEDEFDLEDAIEDAFESKLSDAEAIKKKLSAKYKGKKSKKALKQKKAAKMAEKKAGKKKRKK